MNQRKARMLVVVVGLFVAAVLWGLWKREPRYEGRSLSFWLEEMNRAGGIEECEPALKAIRSMGAGALPFLLKNIRAGNPSAWEEKVFALTENFEVLARIIPVRMLNLSPTCLALRDLGTNAATIVPELEKLFLEPDSGAWPALALLSIGSNAAPSFVKGCESSAEDTRVQSALFLAKVIEARQEWWSWAWGASPKSGRRQLSLGFETMTENDARVLARHLEHDNAGVRRASAEALKKHGSYDRPVIDALRQAAKDERPEVRKAAEEALFMFELRKRNDARDDSAQPPDE